MKKQLTILAVLLCLIQMKAFSQPCAINSSTTFYLQSQSALDDFATNYPSCTSIELNVRIVGDDITDLSNLSNITHIQGYLRIVDCPNLQTLNGLQNLEHIGDYLRIQDNLILSDISALNGIEYLGEELILDELPLLSTTGQFSKLDSIKGEFRIDEILDLPQNAFPQLEYVKFLIIRNNNFSSLNGFSNLTTIEEKLEIRNNELLNRINAFTKLESIGTDLTIELNDVLETIAGFDNMKSIGNSLELHDNPMLSDIDQAFNGLETIEYLFSIEANGLQNFSGFKSLHTIGPAVIHLNPELMNFSGLEALRTINGELLIWDNVQLNDIGAVGEVDYSKMYIRYDNTPGWDSHILYLLGNPLLQSCDVKLLCDLLKRTEPYLIKIANNGDGCTSSSEVIFGQCKSHHCFTGGLSISAIEELDTLFQDLPVCNYIDGDLIIGANAILADNKILDLSILEFIDTIAGDVIIENTLLKEVVGLYHVNYVGGELRIANNPNLERVSILLQDQMFEEVRVENNPKLTEEFRITLTDMKGNVIIRNNPLLESMDIELNSTLEGDIIIEDNPLAAVDLDTDFTFYLDGNLLIRNVKRNNFLNMDGVSGDIRLDNVYSLASYSSVNIDSILGSLIFENNPNVEIIKFNNVEYIGGNLELINNEQLSLFTPTGSANDPDLRYIGGDLKIINTKFNDAALKEELEYLRTVGGELVISDNPELEALTAFNSLMYNTTSGITITNNSALNDCDLKTLCWQMANNPGTVEISGNNGDCADYQAAESNCDLETCVGGLGAHVQEQIDRWLEINEICSVIPGGLSISDATPTWDTISLLGLKNIKEVRGDVSFYGGGLDSLNGLENLRTIGGDMEISNIHLDFNLSALRNLESIGGTFESATGSFKGLEKLERVGSLYLALENTQSLEGLESLKRIEGNLILRFLDITSLKGLENLEYVGGRLEIFNLDQLTDISAISGIPAEPIDVIKVHGNNKLTQCDYRLFCEFIYLYPPSPWFILVSNGEGCFDNDLDCGDLFDLDGTVYYDANQNGQRDSTEHGIPNISLSMEEGSQLTNDRGMYRLLLEEGESFSIAIEEDPLWSLTSSPEEYSGVVDSSTMRSNLDFGLTPNFSEHAVSLNITSNNIRCSESGTYYIEIQNTGTFTENGEIHLQYDQDLGLESSDLTPIFHDEDNGLIVWAYDNLDPYESIDIKLQMLHPDFNSAGDILKSEVVFYNLEDSDLIKVSDYKYETILRCSYDPNDKQINPVGKYSEAYILRDEAVTYTIRFQNTGNDYARNISVIDTLPAAVDMSSFQVVNSSHEVNTSVNDHEVTFNFYDIYLVDSLTNPDLSQGFVSFQVKLNMETPDFTLIENNADIFFDFNPPIRTNTVTNTVVEDFPTSVFETTERNQFDIYPNPFNGEFNLVAYESGRVQIYDASFRLVKSIDMQEAQSNIDMTKYNDGIYYISFLGRSGSISWDKIVKF